MIKKILLSLAMFGFVFGSPILANAQSFTNLKAQLFDLSSKIENFKKVEGNGEVLGATSTQIKFFKATPSSVPFGGSSTIAWEVEPSVDKCEFNAIGDLPKKVPLNGSEIFNNITSKISAKLVCFGSQISVAEVSIDIEGSIPPTLSFVANPTLVSYGGSSTLSWTSTNTVQCWASSLGSSGDGTGDEWLKNPDKTNVLNGSFDIKNITSDVSFSFACYGKYGSLVYKQVYINVIPTVDLKANPTKVLYGGSTTLSWNTKNVYKGCIASNGWTGEKSNNGSQIISNLTKTTVFTLVCKGFNPTNQTKASVTVIVSDIKDAPTDYPGPGPTGDTKGDTERISTNTGTSSSICNFVFTKDLAYGSTDSVKNKDVSLMQSVLVDEGFLSSKDASGKFYSITQSALKKFQRKYGLSQTGKVDQKTRVKLNELFPVYCSQ